MENYETRKTPIIFNTISKREKIILEPSCLVNIEENIILKLKEKYENKCFDEIGYINEIKCIKQIIDNDISSVDCNIIFDVEIDLDVFKPQIGMIMYGKVDKLFEKQGIFLKIKDCIKIFIPEKHLLSCNYTYSIDNTGKKYVNSISNKCISEEKNIYFRISIIKYTNNSFNCLGELHEEEI